MASTPRGGPQGVAIGGFMGTGKSTVGPLLAAYMGLPFVDLDGEVERSAGLSVGQIFATEGEASFRQWEQCSLRQVSSRGPSVVALGGGTLHQAGWKEALADFRVVVLCASWDVVQERIHSDERVRPLLTDAQSLYQQRLPGYAAAGIQVQVDGLSPEQVLGQLVDRLSGARA